MVGYYNNYVYSYFIVKLFFLTYDKKYNTSPLNFKFLQHVVLYKP